MSPLFKTPPCPVARRISSYRISLPFGTRTPSSNKRHGWFEIQIALSTSFLIGGYRSISFAQSNRRNRRLHFNRRRYAQKVPPLLVMLVGRQG